MTPPQTYLAPRAPETAHVPRRRAPVTLAVGGVLAVALVISAAWGGLATLGARRATVSAAASGVPHAITIKADSADVDVVTGDVDRPTFTYRLPWPIADDAFRQTMSGTMLTAELRTRTSPMRFPWSTGATLLVTVPASSVESLLITTETGSIDVSVDAVTEVLSTGTGSIGVSGHLIALTAETGTGSVDVWAQDAQTVTASTSTGSLTVHLTGTPPTVVAAETGTGSILVEVPAGRYAVDAESGTGSVADGLTRDDTSTLVVKASTGTGSIALRHS